MEISPVIKWAGGKRQLLPIIVPMMPENYGTYYEPFFGGGALYCEIKPKKAIINDFNKQLIIMYKQIKRNPDAVCEELQKLQDEYNSRDEMKDKDELYYKYREEFNKNIVSKSNTPECAALLIFLNKAGFNGLFRVNASGLYNVPPAHRKIINAYDADNIKTMSKILKKTSINCGDFEKACKNAVNGDFVFFDSPYYDTFDTYQAGGFSEDDHVRLFKLYKKLSDEGVYCMLTNNDCDFIKELYKDYRILEVDVKRMINCDGNKRTGKEVIITNYETITGRTGK